MLAQTRIGLRSWQGCLQSTPDTAPAMHPSNRQQTQAGQMRSFARPHLAKALTLPLKSMALQLRSR
jgi:hypothetical protein